MSSPQGAAMPRKHIPRRALGLAALSALIVASLAVAAPAHAATNTLAPGSITTTAGTTGSGQSVGNLAVNDQSGSQDNWEKYVEFTPGSSSYNGYRTFTLPGSVTPSSVTAIQTTVNYRGPATGAQTWTWALWNWTTSAWTSVGTNATAPSWGSWKLLTFTSPSSASSFVSSAGAIRLRLLSNDASDSANIDYESLLVTSTGGADTIAPTTPTGLAVTGTTSSSVSLSWTASTDAVGVTGYEVFQGSSTTPVATPTGTSATISGLTASTAYQFRIKARDAAGNRSAYSSTVTGTTTAPPDTGAPTTPTGLTVTGTTSSSVSLSWTASTDAVGVTGYEVFQGSSTTPVAAPAGTSATISGLTASTAYQFRIKARDAAGNRSAYSSTVTATTAAPSSIVLPTANARFDYQIGGPYTPLSSVGVVSRDRLVAPAAGKYNVCYVNLMQTQPDEPGQSVTNPPYGTTQWWKNNHFSALLPDESTSDPTDVVIDVEWDEVVFDLRTAAKRAALLEIQKPWLDSCKSAGYSAIEPDNLDTYTRSINAGGTQQMTFTHNVEYLKLVIPYAHSIGLAVAQKNVNSEFADWQTATGKNGKNFVDTVTPAQGFDFAIAEECQAYEECTQYTAVYGNLIYEIEYTDNNPNQTRAGVTKTAYAWACSDRGASQSIILRDRDVTAPTGASPEPVYRYEAC